MRLAKTTRPSTQKAYPRTRLFRLLDRHADRPVTWVGGPPGAGKTTLVASYLAARRPRSLWYQVDDGDADVARLLYDLGQAAPRGGGRRALPLWLPEQRATLSTFARRFARELYGRLGRRFVLVLDNVQEVPAASGFADVVDVALSELPPGGRAIVISRGAPPGRFARLRANQALHVLGWNDLQLSLRETAEVARRVSRRRLGRRAVEALHASAGGWAAGVVLLIQEAKGGETSTVVPRSGPQAVFDYFAAEILTRADPVTRDVLLSTAWLTRMTPRMVSALTGHPAADGILERLHRENYFTSKHGAGEPVYQYHPLFRQFLVATAAATMAEDRRRHLRRLSASLLEEAGEVEEAAELLRGIEAWDALGDLVERRAEARLQTGRSETVARWLQALGDDLVGARPPLLYYRGVCRQGSDPAAGFVDFERAFVGFRQDGDLPGAARAWMALMETAAVMMDDAASLDRWIGVGETLLAAISGQASRAVEALLVRGLLIAVTMRQPQHPEAPVWADRAEALARELAGDQTRLGLLVAAVFYHATTGDLARVSALLGTAREIAYGGEVSALGRLVVELHVARNSWWFNGDGEKALEAVEAALTFAEKTGVHALDVTLMTEGILAALTAGDTAAVDRFQRRLARGAPPSGRDGIVRRYYALGWTALLRGDLAVASAERERLLKVALEMGMPFVEVLARVFSAQVLRACGRSDEADAELRRAHTVAMATKSAVLMHEVLIPEADRAFGAGREAEGRAMLADALRIGRERGYMNVLVWHPATMARLCVKALEEGIEPDHVRALIRRRRIAPATRPEHLEPWPWPVRVYTLGRFAVLRDDEPVRFARKAQRKPLDLLKALVALGGRSVKEERLTEALWPEADGADAHDALSSAILRLRKLLGSGEAVQRQAGRLSLDPRHCWIDAWALESLLDRADAARRRGADDEVERCVARASAMYEGGFLGDDPELPWAAAMRDRLRRRLRRALETLARGLEERDAAGAAALYERALGVEPWAEEAARRLMRLLHLAGRRADAIAVYERCRTALETWRGLDPAPATTAAYRLIVQESRPRPHGAGPSSEPRAALAPREASS